MNYEHREKGITSERSSNTFYLKRSTLLCADLTVETTTLAGSSFFSLSYGLAAATATTAVAAETTITTTAVAAAAADLRSKNTPAVKYCRRGIFYYERGITTEIKPALSFETAFPDS